MDKDLFADLTASLKEAASIAKGQAFPSRSFKISGPDVKSVREQTGLSQSEFALLLRVSVKTLQNWEQNRRQPTGPAAALLKDHPIRPSRHYKHKRFLDYPPCRRLRRSSPTLVKEGISAAKVVEGLHRYK